MGHSEFLVTGFSYYCRHVALKLRDRSLCWYLHCRLGLNIGGGCHGSHCAGELEEEAEENSGLAAGVLAAKDLWFAAEEAVKEIGRMHPGE
jgi:hypothetical protein